MITLFGTTLDGTQIAALVGLLATLGLWLVILMRERRYTKWFRQWEADRKARFDAEQAAKNPEQKREPTGPWG